MVHPAILEIRRRGRPSKFGGCCGGRLSCRPLACRTLSCQQLACCGGCVCGTEDLVLEGLPVKGISYENTPAADEFVPWYDPSLPEKLEQARRDPLKALQCCSRRAPRRHSRRRTFSSLPDSPDPRDHLANFATSAEALPSKVDLRAHQDRRMHNQGEACSCVAGAIATAFHFNLLKLRWERWADFAPSLLFINFNLRFMEAASPETTVASLRDGIKSVKLWGICPESQWPYDASKMDERPPPTCYRAARTFRAAGYRSLQQTLPQLKGCLATGQPFVFGFIVHDSFNSDAVEHRGEVALPEDEADDDPIEGGHTACAIGYSDDRKVFIVCNSWGPGWGDKGCFYMPYEYVLDPKLAYDFWCISWIKHDTPQRSADSGCPLM